jgi:hypothetical protein
VKRECHGRREKLHFGGEERATFSLDGSQASPSLSFTKGSVNVKTEDVRMGRSSGLRQGPPDFDFIN